MIRLLLTLAFILLAIPCQTAIHAAHPFHVCVGQMEWNGEKNLWEVSLRVHPQDLERAVSQDRSKPASIDSPDFSEQVIPYLSKQFAIVDAPQSMALVELIAGIDSMESPARSELRWVGMEPERGWLWLHLEMIPPKNLSPDHPVWLIHRIFLDTIDRQENSVRIIHGKNRYSLQFRRGQEAHPMKTDTVASKDSSRIPSSPE